MKCQPKQNREHTNQQNTERGSGRNDEIQNHDPLYRTSNVVGYESEVWMSSPLGQVPRPSRKEIIQHSHLFRRSLGRRAEGEKHMIEDRKDS